MSLQGLFCLVFMCGRRAGDIFPPPLPMPAGLARVTFAHGSQISNQQDSLGYLRQSGMGRVDARDVTETHWV
jgi:hypothetical protein